MTTSQRVSIHRLGVFVAASMLLITSMAVAEVGREIATCGKSSGYGYYPKAGLAAANNDAGKWIEDAISGGKFTLTQTSEKEFDLLITDTSGRVFSATQDGGVVFLSGAANGAVSVVVSYPATTVTETYTFFRTADGKAEAMWTSNKGGGAPIMKVTAFRADCSFFAF
jgi:hypothetical protein